MSSSSCIDGPHVAASGTTEQLFYIPCNLCNIVLAVSVPCSSMYDIVTVRCGHCSNLWSVNMAAAATFQALSATTWQLHDHPPPAPLPPPPPPPPPFAQGDNNSRSYNNNPAEYRIDHMGVNRFNMNKMGAVRQQHHPLDPNPHQQQTTTVNRPPEKRQRVPSAYNQFIKEEIQRIKANNPDISHREAFSTAAKNWAHFPHIHFGLMLESNNQHPKLDESGGKLRMSRAALLNK